MLLLQLLFIYCVKNTINNKKKYGTSVCVVFIKTKKKPSSKVFRPVSNVQPSVVSRVKWWAIVKNGHVCAHSMDNLLRANGTHFDNRNTIAVRVSCLFTNGVKRNVPPLGPLLPYLTIPFHIIYRDAYEILDVIAIFVINFSEIPRTVVR